MRPTVITGLADSTRCMQEEIFGQWLLNVPLCHVILNNECEVRLRFFLTSIFVHRTGGFNCTIWHGRRGLCFIIVEMTFLYSHVGLFFYFFFFLIFQCVSSLLQNHHIFFCFKISLDISENERRWDSGWINAMRKRDRETPYPQSPVSLFTLAFFPGGYLGKFLLGMCRWSLRAPIPL